MATARSIAPGAALRFSVDLEPLADGWSVRNRSVRFAARKWRLGSVLRGEFADSQHQNYYVSPARCGGGKGKEKEKKKKKLKLLKKLSNDLQQMFASGKEDEEGTVILEAQKVLLAELERLRSAEMEMKTKERARALIKQRDCCESESESESSSSSESSDSDCEENKVMMMKSKSQRRKANSAIIQDIGTILPVGVLKEEERNGDILVTGASSSATVGKIEVCMGGKCKKQGAMELMDDFQRKVGGGATVVSCKCMGKCKNAPNVRVSSGGFQKMDGLDEKQLLCIGVGLEDVDAIVAHLLGGGSGIPPLATAVAY